MKRSSELWCCLALLVIEALSLGSCGVDAEDHRFRHDQLVEEYRVYSKILTGRNIDNQTTVFALPNESLKSTLEWVTDGTELGSELVTDFMKRNRESQPLRHFFNSPLNRVTLLDHKKCRQYMSGREGWGQFSSDFPMYRFGSNDVIAAVSRVGFSRNMSQALVYAGFQSFWSSSSKGSYYILGNENHLWTVRRKFTVWRTEHGSWDASERVLEQEKALVNQGYKEWKSGPFLPGQYRRNRGSHYKVRNRIEWIETAALPSDKTAELHPTYARETEEYRVYSEVIPAKIIENQTITFALPSESLLSTLEWVTDETEKGPELVADFIEKNREPQPLPPLANSPQKNIRLLSPEDSARYMSSRESWAQFNRDFAIGPIKGLSHGNTEPRGIARVSRIGFSKNLSHALVYAELQSFLKPWSLSRGHYYILVNEDYLWRIQTKVEVWKAEHLARVDAFIEGEWHALHLGNLAEKEKELVDSEYTLWTSGPFLPGQYRKSDLIAGEEMIKQNIYWIETAALPQKR